MRYPQLIIFEPDTWLVRLLGELAGESRWVVREPRSSDNALALLREGRPGVLLVHFEPADVKLRSHVLVGDAHRLFPDLPIIAVSATKLPDEDRAAWSAAMLDLGARYVLFPPLTRPVLEDVVSGLMAISVRRVLGDPNRVPIKQEEILDLAREGNAE